MGETTNQIESEIVQKRSELSDNLIELKQKAKAAVDWRAQVEERPGTMISLAFAGGIVLSALFSVLRGPAKIYAQRSSSGNAAEHDGPVSKGAPRPPSRLASATRKNLDALGGALLGIVATRTTRILEGILPGFQGEFERARNSQGQI
ncbi:MAG TPA: hypothetical protein VN902_11075 [Candidatus Acidoferrales bacterium]|jgi:hypothetical protein|nr:hypothetical protein [Candidatus Acidoferrales bacterium]